MNISRKVSAFWKTVFLFVMIALPSVLAAQESGKGEFYGSVDFSSKHLWRGMPAGESPMVKPEVGYNKGDFYVYLWGAFDFKDTYREVNIGFSYTIENLTLEFIDYMYPWSKDDIFKLANKTTTHQMELIATYEFEKLPFYISAGSCVYGDDKNEKGNHAFSTYVEGGYTHEFNEKNMLSAVAGFSVGKGYYTDYTKNFDLVNLTAEYTRLFNVFDTDVPVTASYTYNPYLKKSWVYATVGISF